MESWHFEALNTARRNAIEAVSFQISGYLRSKKQYFILHHPHHGSVFLFVLPLTEQEDDTLRILGESKVSNIML